MNRLLHTRYAIPWVAVAAASVPGAVLVLAGLGFHDQRWALRAMAGGLLLLALPAAFVLDDPSTPVAGATPRSPWWDLADRLVTVGALCGVMGAVAWMWHALEPIPQAWLLALIPACLAVLAVAGSAVMRRAGRTTPGDVLAGGLAFVILGLSMFRPTAWTWELLPSPGTAGSAEVGIWVGAAAAAIVVIGWAPSGRGTRTAVDA